MRKLILTGTCGTKDISWGIFQYSLNTGTSGKYRFRAVRLSSVIGMANPIQKSVEWNRGPSRDLGSSSTIANPT